jgi:mRNA interferase HigB
MEIPQMRVISNRRLVAFSERHPDSAEALQAWRKIVEKNELANFAHLKSVFNSVDIVGGLFVFDIKGNNYRLICGINFKTQCCYIREVMTHTEYDRGKWK